MSGIRAFLARFSAATIPRREFELTFSRSSGPGGQNVNKVNSKASIRCSAEAWSRASWLPAEVKERIHKEKFPYFTKSGDVYVSSESTRFQRLNIDDCFNKLASAIKHAVYIPAEASPEAANKWAKIQANASKKRLQEKKLIKLKKQSRKFLT